MKNNICFEMKLVFISDIHSNLEALEAVLKEIEKIGPREVYCIGDLCGYGANPKEVIRTVRELNIPCSMGNHDFAIATGDTSWFNPYAAEAIEWTRKQLNEEELSFLSNLKLRMLVTVSGIKILMVHGSPKDYLYDYLYEPDQETVRNVECEVLVVGHTHIPFIREVGDKIVLNAGSVGQPRDGDPRASFVVFDVDSKKAEIVRVEYDIDKAAQKIINSGLPRILAERLYEGV
jgi:putative phosphoesterase